ncbi:MAG: ATPase, partial [Candidatus Methanoperedens sp.]|nr:ATPase [Candidatus Methanoperedens sp.]
DLARPVITVSDFETGNIEYEIYTYGEQVVVMPVGESRGRPQGMWTLAEREIRKELQKYTGGSIEVKVDSDSSATVFMDEDDIAGVIGKGGKNIDRIERKLGVHLNIRVQEDREENNGIKITRKESMISSLVPKIERTKKYVILNVAELSGKTVDVYSGDDFLFTATSGRKGDIRVGKDTEEAFMILKNPLIVTMRLSSP